MPYTPLNDAKIFAEYNFDFGHSGGLTVHVDDEWASRTAVNPVPAAQPLGTAHTAKNGFLNASLIYTPFDRPWTLQVWAKNLTNQFTVAAPSDYYFYFLTTAEYVSGLRDVERGVVSPPREVGATLSYRF